MGIKSIFSMLKADRYTQDGRDKLAEDKTYQTGQISEKTGLQKQPDGSWKPPKGNASKSSLGGEAGSQSLRAAAKAVGEVNKAKTIKQKTEILEEYGWNSDDGGQTWTNTINGVNQKIKADMQTGEFKLVKPAGSENKPAGADLSKVTHSDLDVARNKMNTTPEEDQMLDYFVTEMHEDNTGLDEIIKRQDGVFERSNGAYPEEEKTYKSLRDKIMKHYSGDSAPRQLTGDTRLRLSQVTDKKRMAPGKEERKTAGSK